MRTRALIITGAVAAIVILVVALAIGLGRNGTPPAAVAAGTPGSPSVSPSSSQAAAPAEAPVQTTFKTEQRRPFEAPVELRSANGQLRTAFTVEPTTFSVAGAKVKGYAYQGNYIGPTLRVRPGDTVRIDLTNRLGEPTNLHGHGMFMSPIGISDNVLRVMKSGTFNHIEWKLPSDIDPGRTGTTHTYTDWSSRRSSLDFQGCSSSTDSNNSCRQRCRASRRAWWRSRICRSKPVRS